jgi:hypothetical protein
MERYEGVGVRIRARLVVLGYAKPDGELDVQRFCFDHRFDKTNVYNWLRDSYTPLKDLTRLCDALDCSERWLLTGAERKKASPRRHRGTLRSLLLGLAAATAAAMLPSGAGAAQPLSGVKIEKIIPLLGSRRRGLGMVAA